MAKIHSIQWPGETRVPVDTITGTTGYIDDDGGTRGDFFVYQDRKIRGQEWRVMMNPRLDQNTGIQYIDLGGSSLSVWSLRILYRQSLTFKDDINGRFIDDVGFRIHANIDEIWEMGDGGYYKVQPNAWNIIQASCDGSAISLWINGVLQTDAMDPNTLNLNSPMKINAYNYTVSPRVEMAYIDIYDEALSSPVGDEAQVGDQDSLGSFSGMALTEEYGFETGSWLVDIGQDYGEWEFDGLTCWGGLATWLPDNQYFKLSATFNWDDYIEGTGHVNNSWQVCQLNSQQERTYAVAGIGLFYDDQTQELHSPYIKYVGGNLIYLDTGTDTPPTPEARTVLDPLLDHTWSLEANPDDGFFYTLDDITFHQPITYTTERWDYLMIGPNAGYHFGPGWRLRIKDIDLRLQKRDYVEPEIEQASNFSSGLTQNLQLIGAEIQSDFDISVVASTGATPIEDIQLEMHFTGNVSSVNLPNYLTEGQALSVTPTLDAGTDVVLRIVQGEEIAEYEPFDGGSSYRIPIDALTPGRGYFYCYDRATKTATEKVIFTVNRL